MICLQQTPLSADQLVEFLGEIFERRGGEEYLGEPVTMAEHMLQSAYLAEQQRLTEELVVAALLHDIGHFTSEFGTFSMDDTEDRRHEQAGADLLATYLPDVVIDCIRYHVAAKRYLCATQPDYHAQLSLASRHSLQLQGGPMSTTEVTEFERNPNLQAIVAVRYLDDAGKSAAQSTPAFSHYAPMIRRVTTGFMRRTADQPPIA